MKTTLTLTERHALAIAKANAKMNPIMAAMLGGPSPEEAKKIVKKLAKK